MDKYKVYEAEKRKLQEKVLAPAEYDAEIRKLVERLEL